MLSLLALVMLSTEAAAVSYVAWDYGIGYVDTYGTYVPYKGSAGYSVGGTPSSGILLFNSRMTFNQTVVNAISNHMSTHNRYFTWDVSNINDYDTTISATGWYSTTLPNPKFDFEDDPWPFGNGYCDETEVVALSLVSSNVEYAYFAEFSDRRTGTSGGTVEARAGLSVRSVTGEYNTVYQSSIAQGVLTYGSTPGQY